MLPPLLLAFLAFIQLRATDFVPPPGDDDAVAGRALARWSTGIGFKPEKVTEGGEFVLEETYVWIVEIKTSKSFLDRLVFTAVFSGSKSNVNNPAVLAFVNELNSRYNVGCFNVDSDGDIIFQFTMTFDDILSPVAYRKFIKSVELMTGVIFNNHKSDFDRFTK